MMATILVNALLFYLAIGVLFAIAFVIVGVGKIDDGALGAPWFFRLLIFPGAIAFWPYLLSKWIKGNNYD
ncbi:MAG: hypothetical protein MK226_09930 [Saprospiraceae bacterium]|jgi:hypothetical protein|nr:hypothetical protein [Saprospiraceae bacterium]